MPSSKYQMQNTITQVQSGLRWRRWRVGAKEGMHFFVPAATVISCPVRVSPCRYVLVPTNKKNKIGICVVLLTHRESVTTVVRLRSDTFGETAAATTCPLATAAVVAAKPEDRATANGPCDSATQ